jgi:hypothetical protein
MRRGSAQESRNFLFGGVKGQEFHKFTDWMNPLRKVSPRPEGTGRQGNRAPTNRQIRLSLHKGESLGVKKGLPAGKNGMGIQSIRANLLPKGLL